MTNTIKGRNGFMIMIISLLLPWCFVLLDGKEPVLNRFEISNFELTNLETGSFTKYLFKKNNCETGGYSFFSPFYEDKSLPASKVDAIVKGSEIRVKLKNEGKTFDFVISDFKVSEEKNVIDFIVTKDNYRFPCKLFGVYLTEKYVFSLFNKLTDVSVVKDNHQACGITTMVYVAYQVIETNKNVQNACFPCNGTLKVQKCSCECSPIFE